jgi:hypothetical protein
MKAPGATLPLRITENGLNTEVTSTIPLPTSIQFHEIFDTDL